jgi:hypothetical protein
MIHKHAVCAVVNYRRSILDFMSKAKMKKSVSKSSHSSQGKSAKAFVAHQAKVTAELAKEIPPEPLTFAYGATLVHQSLMVLRRNIESSVIIFVLPSLLTILGTQLISDGNRANGSAIYGLVFLGIGFIWFIASVFAAYPFTVAAAKGNNLSVLSAYKDGLYFAPRIIGLTFLLIPLILLGICLAVLPGVIVVRRYFLAFYYIVDQDADIRESMQLSASQSKPASTAIYSMLIIFALFIAIASAFSRTLAPYGSVAAIIVETLFVFSPALLYLEIQSRNKNAPVSGTKPAEVPQNG